MTFMKPIVYFVRGEFYGDPDDDERMNPQDGFLLTDSNAPDSKLIDSDTNPAGQNPNLIDIGYSYAIDQSRSPEDLINFEPSDN